MKFPKKKPPGLRQKSILKWLMMSWGYHCNDSLRKCLRHQETVLGMVQQSYWANWIVTYLRPPKMKLFEREMGVSLRIWTGILYLPNILSHLKKKTTKITYIYQIKNQPQIMEVGKKKKRSSRIWFFFFKDSGGGLPDDLRHCSLVCFIGPWDSPVDGSCGGTQGMYAILCPYCFVWGFQGYAIIFLRDDSSLVPTKPMQWSYKRIC